MNASVKVMNMCGGDDVLDGGKKFSPFRFGNWAGWMFGSVVVRECGRVLEIFRSRCWVWKGSGREN